MNTKPTVFIIDDDPSVRRALSRVMACAGFPVQDFVSVQEFLSDIRPRGNGCVVADISGLELKRHLRAEGIAIPVIFLTTQDTDESRSAARDAGAAGYFRKPVDTQALLDAIKWSLKKSNRKTVIDLE